MLTTTSGVTENFQRLDWQHRFAELGEAYFADVPPTPLPAPYWIGHSERVATLLGLPTGWENSDHWLQVLTGNAVPEGARPISTVYSGHQFGVWAGQLGDGRAILLGETGGLELQLKGAGLTPFSRMGDGRAVLRSSIREFLCSEAMHGLGIPSSRALSVTGSDAPIRREEIETAAVVARVAPSFVRFGHFEHFCHTNQHEQLRQLTDHVIDRFYPECRQTPLWGGNPYLAFLAAVTQRTADMVAQWQSVGFCHGVMNTDNMSILGLTIDYGPFQFLDAYDPAHICNHSDHQGRYAFYKQPNVAYWNLFCLGQALLPLIEEQDQAIAALETFKTAYPTAFARRMAAKLGFDAPAHLPLGCSNTSSEPGNTDPRGASVTALIEGVLRLLAADKVDFTIFWRTLSHWAQNADTSDAWVRDLFVNRDAIDAWLADYRACIHSDPKGHDAASMLQTNPKYVLRNHLGELAIRAAKKKDFSVTEELLQVLETPFDEHPHSARFADFPPDWAGSIAISCSS